MPTRLKKRTVKKAAAATPRKAAKKPLPHHLSADEVAALESQAAAHRLSEESWLSMISPGKDDGDRWNKVEEHLLAKPHESVHNLRRWKYFSK